MVARENEFYWYTYESNLILSQAKFSDSHKLNIEFLFYDFRNIPTRIRMPLAAQRVKSVRLYTFTRL